MEKSIHMQRVAIWGAVALTVFGIFLTIGSLTGYPARQSRGEVRERVAVSPILSTETSHPVSASVPSSETTPSSTCEFFMGEHSIFDYQTSIQVLDDCDRETFIELDYQYAKDKNLVYFRPMPNANFMTIVLEGADPETFQLSKRCTSLALDKNHVYQGGEIVENKDPRLLEAGYIEGRPETSCY